MYRHRPELIGKLKGFARQVTASAESTRGTIGVGARIMDSGLICNVKVGAGAVIDGAARLSNGTLVSRSDSPVIIACLIVYSYSGLEWKTAWPYLAGGLTVLLQVWRRNSLLSIVLGTVLYMFLVSGCTTVRDVSYGVDNPILELSSLGLKFDGRFVKPEEVPDLLEEYQIPHDAVIHIGITSEVQHELRQVRVFMGYLAKKGYRRSVLVTDMHGESSVVNKGVFR